MQELIHNPYSDSFSLIAYWMTNIAWASIGISVLCDVKYQPQETKFVHFYNYFLGVKWFHWMKCHRLSTEMNWPEQHIEHAWGIKQVSILFLFLFIWENDVTEESLLIFEY